MHTMSWLGGDDTSWPDFLVGVRHRHLIPACHRGQQTLELSLGESHTDTTPRAVQERDLSVVALRTSSVCTTRL